MMYDDIAEHSRNPWKGELYNSPTGDNVYDKDAIDYRGSEVNKNNFFSVLKGDAKATGGKPVLQSNSDSKVFVFFSDHGAPGLVQMPHGDVVFADEL